MLGHICPLAKFISESCCKAFFLAFCNQKQLASVGALFMAYHLGMAEVHLDFIFKT